VESTRTDDATKPVDLVAALFFNEMSARDAIADLKIAGLRAGQIGVALSKRGKLEHSESVPVISTEKHSILWKFRHSFEHDLHKSGAGLSSTQDALVSTAERTPYTEVDLDDTLRGIGVARPRSTCWTAKLEQTAC